MTRAWLTREHLLNRKLQIEMVESRLRCADVARIKVCNRVTSPSVSPRRIPEVGRRDAWPMTGYVPLLPEREKDAARGDVRQSRCETVVPTYGNWHWNTRAALQRSESGYRRSRGSCATRSVRKRCGRFTRAALTGERDERHGGDPASREMRVYAEKSGRRAGISEGMI